MDDFSQLFADMTPEEKEMALTQILGLGTLDEQDDMYQEQMAMADALAPKGPRNWGPGAAGPIGAIADVFGAGVNAYKQNQFMKERDKLLKDKVAGRREFAKIMGGGYRPKAAAVPVFGGIDDAPEMMDDGIPQFLRRPF